MPTKTHPAHAAIRARLRRSAQDDVWVRFNGIYALALRLSDEATSPRAALAADRIAKLALEGCGAAARGRA